MPVLGTLLSGFLSRKIQSFVSELQAQAHATFNGL
jgi:hypothetical protein